MVLYLSLLVFYLLCILVEKIFSEKLNKKLWIIFLMMPPFVLTAFRAPIVGNDTYNYFNSYLRVSEEPMLSQSTSSLEVGYVVLMKLFGLLNVDYIGFQILTVAFIYFSLGRFIYKYSSKFAVSIFVFLTLNMFFQTMNISRQYIAIAILTYSVSYILNKKPIKFTAIVIVAALFHQTALIFFIMYYITNTVLTKIKISVLITLGIVISLGFDYLIRYTTPFIGDYETYLDSQYFNPEGNIATVFLLLLYFAFFIVGFLTNYAKKNHFFSINYLKNKNFVSTRELNKKEKMIFGAVIIIFIMSIIGLNTTIMSRLISYFLIFYLIYIPDVLSGIRDKNIKVIITMLAITGLAAYFLIIMLLRPEWTGVIPYFWYMKQ